MALSTDFVLRTGATDPTTSTPADPKEAQAVALRRWEAVKGNKPEKLVTGSDDFTMYLWEPSVSKKPLLRMTGHQQLINQVSFSPDGRYFASASFDKAVKVWDGLTGKFLAALRGHVGAVYQVCWSADSRIVVSASKDSTIKLWNFRTKKMLTELPGHADEVYSLDWSPDGESIVSGGKDRVLKIWKY
jgi:ribosome assembly protein 4